MPECISSANHGTFAAEVAKLICEILGVENRVFSAVYNSRSQAHIDNRNHIISDVIAGAESKDDITCDTDLNFALQNLRSGPIRSSKLMAPLRLRGALAKCLALSTHLCLLP